MVHMSWEPELEELRRRRELAEQMGGPEKVARQQGRGKLDARARIAALVDAGSFREIGKIAGKGTYDEDGALTDLDPPTTSSGVPTLKVARSSPPPMISPSAAARPMPRSTAR